MNKEKIKVGVVGSGHIVTHRHIPVLKKLKNAEVVAICDIRESSAKSVANRYGIKQYYTNLSGMLKEKLDVVDICTPPQTHASLIFEVIKAGCHVLVEKPLAMSVNDVDDILKLSEEKNVKICVVHQNLFNPVVQKAIHLVNTGYVGDLISVDVSTFIRRDNYMCLNSKHWCHTLPGGIFFEILPHPVYLLQVFLKGIEPTNTFSVRLGNFSWMIADELKVLVKAENGVGSITASCNSPFHGDTLNIFGTKMGLQIDLWRRCIIIQKPRTENPFSVGKSNLYLASQFLNLLGTTAVNSSKMVFGGVKVSAHYGFLNAFIKSIQDNSDLTVHMEDAKENVRIVETICRQIK